MCKILQAVCKKREYTTGRTLYTNIHTRAHTLTYIKYTENAENARRNPRDEDEGVLGKHRRGLHSGHGQMKGRRGQRRQGFHWKLTTPAGAYGCGITRDSWKSDQNKWTAKILRLSLSLSLYISLIFTHACHFVRRGLQATWTTADFPVSIPNTRCRPFIAVGRRNLNIDKTNRPLIAK